MIRKCNISDHDRIMDLLMREKSFNLFMIADIENYGYEADFQEVWAEFENDVIRSVLLRYYSNYIIYDPNNGFSDEFADILKQSDRLNVLSGKHDVIKNYTGCMPFRKIKLLIFSELDIESFIPYENNLFIEKAVNDDAEGLFHLRGQIKEFKDIKGTVNDMRRRITGVAGRTFVLRKNGCIVSSASTTAESSSAAMVGGVMTHPDFRNNGYATACISSLCTELINEKKQVCLFYDNPDAGRIYERIGFKEIGKWILCIK